MEEWGHGVEEPGRGERRGEAWGESGGGGGGGGGGRVVMC